MLTLFLGNFPAFFGHFGYGWYFWPHSGSFSPFLIFFGLLFLFAMLGRGRRRCNSPRGGWYNRGPHGHYGPYGPYSQGPWSGDVQNGQGSSQQGYDQPRANQYNPSQPRPYGYGEPGNYGSPTAPGHEGTPTVRVDPNQHNSSGYGTPTVRVDSPAYYEAGTPTVRVDRPAQVSGGQPTQPLGPAPSFPLDYGDPARGRVEPDEHDRSGEMQS